MTHRPPNGDVVSVATAVVPAVGRPELTELCAAMQAIPVDADDVGRRIGRKRRSGQLADSLELLGWAPAEDVDAPTAPVGRVGEFVRQAVSIASW